MAQDRNLILTVCTGNVCRSPMAEKLLQHALAAEGAPLDQLNVESAGVAAG
jgi:protein-tyrosine-phosphatase